MSHTTTTTPGTLPECPVPDEDGDGEADSTDRCPGTPLGMAVDDGGCSEEQFCARFDVTTAKGRKLCKRADWQNDNPAPRRHGDCEVLHGKVAGNRDRCVPAP